MLEFKLGNADLLMRKAKKQQKLRNDKNKNMLKFTNAFEELLSNNDFKALMILAGDEFRFENAASLDYSIPKNYGIKGGKFVFYFSDSKSKAVDDDDFDEPVSKTAKVTVIKEKSRSIKVTQMVEELMRATLDIEPIYNNWIQQLMDLAGQLSEGIDESELSEEDLDDVTFDNVDEDEADDAEVMEDEPLEEEF